ncbi:MAG TPA: phage terminase small subunit P27 family [Bryobacteraceae bacterium]|jgi:P27 family predicted phage terminase small subunit
MMGRPPTPSALKILAGNPGRRPINDREPKLEIKAPACPEHLDDVARREWDRVVPILLRMRVLTEADEIALGNMCMVYATLIDAQNKLKSSGLLYKTQSGYVQANPLLAVVNKCIYIISKIQSEFGLTPAARVRLHADAAGDESANKWSDVG